MQDNLEIFRPEKGQVTLPQEPVRVIGIDLGTTNSTVTEIIWTPGEANPSSARCLSIDQQTTQGRYTHVLVPSVVALYQGQKWVGEGAKRLRAPPEAGLEEGKTLFAECKNDMGLKRTYHRAPEGFRSAKEIASHVLKYLHEAALIEDKTPINRVVVTVPASFQAAQRHDTLEAAQIAGLELRGGDLLDEPIAAFLDYLVHHKTTSLPEAGETRTLLVFDFGGGTCDVAVLRLGRTPGGRVTAMPLSVSRYQRLGGGDIDRAILFEVLLPQLLEQNGLDPFALSYQEKRQEVEPALLGVAEALKHKLCTEIHRLMRLRRWESMDKAQVVQIQPGAYPVDVHDQRLILKSPSLSAVQFQKLLQPFLDRDLLYPKEDEYRLTCSVFAPLTDAVQRAGLSPAEIDLCLLVGGSSLIPQVAEAVGDFFPKAQMLTYSDRDDVQTAVARGAAVHAMALALFGKPLVQPVCHDDICFRTKTGPVILVPKGASLPYPPEGDFARRDDFQAPETILSGFGAIRISIAAGNEQRPLFSETWYVPAPVSKGELLALQYRFDENQILQLHMSRPEATNAEEYRATIENPLTLVLNPQETRAQIDEIEEELRTGQVQREDIPEKMEELADLYRKLGQNEKALDYYKRVLRSAGKPQAYLLNRMALCAQDMGDRERADRFFREATEAESWSGSWFNWALAKERWEHFQDAVDCVKKAWSIEQDPAYLVLQARLAHKMRNETERDKLLKEALRLFGPISGLSDFSLGWLGCGARLAGDDALAVRAEAELRARRQAKGQRVDEEGELVDHKSLPMRVNE